LGIVKSKKGTSGKFAIFFGPFIGQAGESFFDCRKLHAYAIFRMVSECLMGYFSKPKEPLPQPLGLPSNEQRLFFAQNAEEV